MKNKPKNLTVEDVQNLINETAATLKAKKEIYEEAKKLEAKLSLINEHYNSFANSYGFKSDSDMSNKTKNGFQNDMKPFSNLSQLGAEIQEELDKFDKEQEGAAPDLISEIEKLKQEIAELKKSK